MSAREVGQRLREAREQRKLELAEAARATRIRSHYLLALEEGEFGLLPSPAQVRGFLRTYAEFLNLDASELLGLLKPKPADGEKPLEGAPTIAAGSQPSKVEANAATFAAIGAELRQRRESLQLTLPEAEAGTRIAEHQLSRLERGEFDSFPSPTQARGLLSNYADFLGLPGEELLLRYAGGLQERFEAKRAETPAKKRTQPKMVFRLPAWLSPLLSRDLLFGGMTGLLLLIFVVWSIGRIAATRAGETPQPTPPPLANLLLATQQPSGGSETSVPGTPGSINLLEQESATPGLLGEATIQVGNLSGVSLRLISMQRTWMRITVDGNVEFEGRTVPGETYTFAAATQITLLSGNGSALRGFLNELDLGILGIYGEVVNIVFTRQGAATPTVSPTPTIDPGILTATADAALTPSPTPTPTVTPSPEPTSTQAP
ncbi:MAG: RodZ domain-containing protein [Anaerolineales bacterium]